MFIMGNNISNGISNDEIKCDICNSLITKRYDYIDMVCSNCNKRCKEYYHSDCFSNYLNTIIANNKFMCQNCLNE